MRAILLSPDTPEKLSSLTTQTLEARVKLEEHWRIRNELLEARNSVYEARTSLEDLTMAVSEPQV